MYHSSLIRTAIYSASALTSLILGCLVILSSRKKLFPSLGVFLGFYFTGILHMGTILIPTSDYWFLTLILSRLRFFFLILFVFSFHRFRFTLLMTVLLESLVALSIVLPFFMYTIIPQLVEIAAIIYLFLSCGYLYLKHSEIALPEQEGQLLRIILLCTGFFFAGLLLDLMESIPQASIYVSILYMDFYPLFMMGLGIGLTLWSKGYSAGKPLFYAELLFENLPVTKREKEVIELIVMGESNGDIADKLFISESTVKKHINNIFRKLNISSRWELLKLTGKSTRSGS